MLKMMVLLSILCIASPTQTAECTSKDNLWIGTYSGAIFVVKEILLKKPIWIKSGVSIKLNSSPVLLRETDRLEVWTNSCTGQLWVQLPSPNQPYYVEIGRAKIKEENNEAKHRKSWVKHILIDVSAGVISHILVEMIK